MKLFFASIITLFLIQPASAATLECWQVGYTNVKAPFMTAKILSNTRLANIRFLYPNSLTNIGTGSESNTLGPVKAKIETSPHSPYKGNATYQLQTGDKLILPIRLENDYLQFIFSRGLGYQPNENAVIIGHTGGDIEAGNHFSFRMVCQSRY